MSIWNEQLDVIRPYTVASHKIWAVKPEDRAKILKLDWNEAVIPPSPKVREKLAALLAQDDFFHLYPSTYNESLMDALSEYCGLPEINIQYFGGSDTVHEYIARAYLKEGDRVLVLWPSYDNFRLTAESTGARLFYGELGQNFVFDQETFVRRIEVVKPRLVYICNPNNPTGTLLSQATIASLLDTYGDILFVVDEAYAEFAGQTVQELVLDHDNLLVTRTLSKAFGLANLRFGYLLASQNNIETVSKIRNPKNINTLTQTAAEAALRDIAYMEDYVREVREARNWFVSEINNGPLHGYMEAYESAGNFVLIRCLTPEIKEVLRNHWESNNIFVRDVRQSASLANCLRVTVGKKSQMEEVIASASLAFIG